MARIRIDIDELCTALEDHDSEWVLDTETGEVLMKEWVRDEKLRADIGLDLDAEAEEWDDDLGDFDPLESGRFVWIEPVSSNEGFRWMERFALRQEDERVREKLLDALDRPRPFRRFKEALHEFPPTRNAWFQYQEEKLKECARAWVEHRELDAELVETVRAPAEPS